MQPEVKAPRPGHREAGGQAGNGLVEPVRRYSTAAPAGRQAWDGIPVALAVEKRGRRCIISKVVPLDGEPVLAVCHRHQVGVRSVISIPVAALDFARRVGCRWLYLRRDRPGEMYRLTLEDAWRVGWLGPGAGVELYIPLARMEPVPWAPWPFAEEVVDLDARPTDSAAAQLPLFDLGGAR